MGMYEQHYLKHYGTKGMKWNVRRYQNKDGTLTPLGKLRYTNKDGSLTERGKKRMYRDMFDQEGKDMKEQRKYVADPTKWIGEDVRNSKEGLDSARQLSTDLKKLTDSSIRSAKSNRATLDLSNMSDKEMRDAINRAMLERQYNDMFAPQASTKGRETVSRVLETAGTVLAIGSSALGIALAVGKLTGKVS